MLAQVSLSLLFLNILLTQHIVILLQMQLPEFNAKPVTVILDACRRALLCLELEHVSVCVPGTHDRLHCDWLAVKSH